VHGNVDMVHRAHLTFFMPYISHDDYDDSDKYKSKTCVRLYMLTPRWNAMHVMWQQGNDRNASQAFIITLRSSSTFTPEMDHKWWHYS